MNRFLINYSPELCARDLCDKHVVKMPLEEAQMLCTTVRLHAPEYAEEAGLYRAVHQKHPCTLWAGKTRANYLFAFCLWEAMCMEYTHRYGRHHASERFAIALYDGARFVPSGERTPHPECFSEYTHLKTGDEWPVESYRKFYHTKQHRFDMRWRNRNKPTWFDWQWDDVYAA
jgi:hypothetical protein